MTWLSAARCLEDRTVFQNISLFGCRSPLVLAVLETARIDRTTFSAKCHVGPLNKDHGISGAKGRDKRPAFDPLCRDAAQRKFDLVMAWSVDRLGRSLQDLVGFLSELHALRIDLFLHQQGLDTTTPAGKAMFQMMGVFAEFERAMIQERVRAGLRRAKDEEKQLGRPRTGRPRKANPWRSKGSWSH
jgi:DNA invertase Pin-like site-specific DNA recombinase